jgi:hypothetical protein
MIHEHREEHEAITKVMRTSFDHGFKAILEFSGHLYKGDDQDKTISSIAHIRDIDHNRFDEWAVQRMHDPSESTRHKLLLMNAILLFNRDALNDFDDFSKFCIKHFNTVIDKVSSKVTNHIKKFHSEVFHSNEKHQTTFPIKEEDDILLLSAMTEAWSCIAIENYIKKFGKIDLNQNILTALSYTVGNLTEQQNIRKVVPLISQLINGRDLPPGEGCDLFVASCANLATRHPESDDLLLLAMGDRSKKESLDSMTDDIGDLSRMALHGNEHAADRIANKFINAHVDASSLSRGMSGELSNLFRDGAAIGFIAKSRPDVKEKLIFLFDNRNSIHRDTSQRIMVQTAIALGIQNIQGTGAVMKIITEGGWTPVRTIGLSQEIKNNKKAWDKAILETIRNKNDGSFSKTTIDIWKMAGKNPDIAEIMALKIKNRIISMNEHEAEVFSCKIPVISEIIKSTIQGDTFIYRHYWNSETIKKMHIARKENGL